LSTTAAPSATRPCRTEIGPLAEVCFSKDHGTGIAKLGDDKGILGSDVPLHGERASGCHHFIARINIVFN
jgi:hypothetical protein